MVSTSKSILDEFKIHLILILNTFPMSSEKFQAIDFYRSLFPICNETS